MESCLISDVLSHVSYLTCGVLSQNLLRWSQEPWALSPESTSLLPSSTTHSSTSSTTHSNTLSTRHSNTSSEVPPQRLRGSGSRGGSRGRGGSGGGCANGETAGGRGGGGGGEVLSRNIAAILGVMARVEETRLEMVKHGVVEAMVRLLQRSSQVSICTHTHTHTYIHTQTHTRQHRHRQTHTNTHTHHTHTHTHTHQYQ